ncbi:GNAT family N-acetyltransferase [Planktothrix sp. FACHB-1355]|uniref:GNAT family N-acetyltransferase n=1 Tax=Aerosakkonema funiforme FACHB-1375 TaxID=2949571 RepID=A0A926ZGQ7_9CYAN|nr:MULTISPECIES: GNAT family N-acetyltransferase [Oscillatoriales]MBD2180066.1 GNAT family N-acetyltransferase [Aerosakkonema funiforme FACHB-1375]MBD3560942.1 GNAT family N-acetyltransferase [Planktothrix sp. FACHB-1355]
MKLDIHIRAAFPEEDALIAEHFYQMWLDNDVTANSIKTDWFNITLEFIDRARKQLAYQAFVAEVERRVVGSVSCQLFAGLYPHILTAEYRHYGYIWGVYVEPDRRRQGIAKQLTTTAVNYLKSQGCTKAILHASPSGLPVYSSLGFSPTNEMKLDLI